MLQFGPAPAGTIDLDQLAAAAGVAPYETHDDAGCDRLVKALSGYDAVWTVEEVGSADDAQTLRCVTARCTPRREIRRGFWKRPL